MTKYAFLLIIPSSLLASPTVSPSTATVKLYGKVQFSSTDTVTWSMYPGSTGTIDSNGLYTAPASIPAKNVSAGCLLLPNDHIYNTRVDNLPVDSNSSTRLNNIGSVKVTLGTDFPLNVLTNNTPTTNMVFNYTPSNDGYFPTLSFPYMGVENMAKPNNYFSVDRHVLGINVDKCDIVEMYNFYPVGANGGCPTCNSQSGIISSGYSYDLPNAQGGSTDAAGLYIQPLAIRYSELKSGSIKHALRFTLSNTYIYSGYLWPGTGYTTQCGNSSTCMPYGSRLRLKSSFDISGFSKETQTILTALKQYGMFLSDGGPSFSIQTMTDVGTDTTTWAAIHSEIYGASTITSAQFEQVDESGLKISDTSGQVKVDNGYVVPDNYAIVLSTKNSDGTATRRYVAVEPATVGTKDIPFPIISGTLSVMAGTPQFQIPYWVNGATTTTVSCSMSPTIGSITSGCLYTAPTSGIKASSTTIITITPDADHSQAMSFPLTILSSDSIRINAGGKSSASSPPPNYDSQGNYGPDAHGAYWAPDPIGLGSSWYGRDDISYPQSSWPGSTDEALWYTDNHGNSDGYYAAMVPNGNYTLKMGFAWNANPSQFVQSIDSQGSVIVDSQTFVNTEGTTAYTPITISKDIQVTDNTFYVAFRMLDSSKFTIINNWSLTYNSPLPASVTKSISATANLKGSGTIQ